MTLQPGQTLWRVAVRFGGRQATGSEVVVASVARKWATLTDGDRVEKNTLYLDSKGYSPLYHYYLSREIYEQRDRAVTAWNVLRSRMNTLGPAVTEADVFRAAELLGITLPFAAPVKP